MEQESTLSALSPQECLQFEEADIIDDLLKVGCTPCDWLLSLDDDNNELSVADNCALKGFKPSLKQHWEPQIPLSTTKERSISSSKGFKLLAESEEIQPEYFENTQTLQESQGAQIPRQQQQQQQQPQQILPRELPETGQLLPHPASFTSSPSTLATFEPSDTSNSDSGVKRVMPLPQSQIPRPPGAGLTRPPGEGRSPLARETLGEANSSLGQGRKTSPLESKLPAPPGKRSPAKDDENRGVAPTKSPLLSPRAGDKPSDLWSGAGQRSSLGPAALQPAAGRGRGRGSHPRQSADGSLGGAELQGPRASGGSQLAALKKAVAERRASDVGVRGGAGAMAAGGRTPPRFMAPTDSSSHRYSGSAAAGSSNGGSGSPPRTPTAAPKSPRVSLLGQGAPLSPSPSIASMDTVASSVMSRPAWNRSLRADRHPGGYVPTMAIKRGIAGGPAGRSKGAPPAAAVAAVRAAVAAGGAVSPRSGTGNTSPFLSSALQKSPMGRGRVIGAPADMTGLDLGREAVPGAGRGRGRGAGGPAIGAKEGVVRARKTNWTGLTNEASGMSVNPLAGGEGHEQDGSRGAESSIGGGSRRGTSRPGLKGNPSPSRIPGPGFASRQPECKNTADANEVGRAESPSGGSPRRPAASPSAEKPRSVGVDKTSDGEALPASLLAAYTASLNSQASAKSEASGGALNSLPSQQSRSRASAASSGASAGSLSVDIPTEQSESESGAKAGSPQGGEEAESPKEDDAAGEASSAPRLAAPRPLLVRPSSPGSPSFHSGSSGGSVRRSGSGSPGSSGGRSIASGLRRRVPMTPSKIPLLGCSGELGGGEEGAVTRESQEGEGGKPGGTGVLKEWMAFQQSMLPLNEGLAAAIVAVLVDEAGEGAGGERRDQLPTMEDVIAAAKAAGIEDVDALVGGQMRALQAQAEEKRRGGDAWGGAGQMEDKQLESEEGGKDGEELQGHGEELLETLVSDDHNERGDSRSKETKDHLALEEGTKEGYGGDGGPWEHLAGAGRRVAEEYEEGRGFLPEVEDKDADTWLTDVTELEMEGGKRQEEEEVSEREHHFGSLKESAKPAPETGGDEAGRASLPEVEVVTVEDVDEEDEGKEEWEEVDEQEAARLMGAEAHTESEASSFSAQELGAAGESLQGGAEAGGGGGGGGSGYTKLHRPEGSYSSANSSNVKPEAGEEVTGPRVRGEDKGEGEGEGAGCEIIRANSSLLEFDDVSDMLEVVPEAQGSSVGKEEGLHGQEGAVVTHDWAESGPHDSNTGAQKDKGAGPTDSVGGSGQENGDDTETSQGDDWVPMPGMGGGEEHTHQEQDTGEHPPAPASPSSLSPAPAQGSDAEEEGPEPESPPVMGNSGEATAGSFGCFLSQASAAAFAAAEQGSPGSHCSSPGGTTRVGQRGGGKKGSGIGRNRLNWGEDDEDGGGPLKGVEGEEEEGGRAGVARRGSESSDGGAAAEAGAGAAAAALDLAPGMPSPAVAYPSLHVHLPQAGETSLTTDSSGGLFVVQECDEEGEEQQPQQGKAGGGEGGAIAGRRGADSADSAAGPLRVEGEEEVSDMFAARLSALAGSSSEGGGGAAGERGERSAGSSKAGEEESTSAGGVAAPAGALGVHSPGITGHSSGSGPGRKPGEQQEVPVGSDIHIDTMSVSIHSSGAAYGRQQQQHSTALGQGHHRLQAGAASGPLGHAEEQQLKRHGKGGGKRHKYPTYEDDDDGEEDGEMPACLRRGAKGQPTCGCVVM